MKLEYYLRQNDFLQYHLYEFSQTQLKKHIRKFIAIYAGIFLVASIFSLISKNFFVAIFFGLITVGIIFIVPSRLKDLYFDNTLKLVRERYLSKYDIYYNLNLDNHFIEFTSEIAINKYSISELVKIVETKAGIYLILKSNFIIIPKSNEVYDKDFTFKLLEFSKELGIDYENNENWKW